MNRRELIKTAGLTLFAPAIIPLSPSRALARDTIKLRDLYKKGGDFSDLALSLEGQRIVVDGFMAPPLKVDMRFFVLTKMPMAVCPFCESEAEWPDDILAIYTKRVVDVVAFNKRIFTSGKLELGGYTDPDTGFVSRVRLSDAVYEEA